MVVLTAIVGSALARSNPPAPRPDPVRTWNELALDTVRLKRAGDAPAARLYAMVNVAMYDAVNGIESRQGHHTGRAHALVPATTAPPQGNLYAAASAAAHAVLSKEFPDQAARYDLQLQSDLAALPSGGHTTAGQAWGAHVGKQVHRQRANDGSTPDETQPAGAGPGQFPNAWSGVQFRNLAPFGIVDPSVYVGAGPPALTSLDYAVAFAEVKRVGNAATPDADKLAAYQYWSLGGGTSQPPGAWIQVALAVTTDYPLFLPEMARLFALTSMAMSDTVAPTVMTKFLFRHWRPTTAIQQAADDGNSRTKPDPNWAPRGGNPGTSPEYWSGHSTFSAAAATVLAGFFCDDAIAFRLITDSAPGGEERLYPSFSAAAAEAGRSRVVGGLHFAFSNQDGLSAGRAVAAEILATRLLRKVGPTHFKQCPVSDHKDER
jgi:hypothetical protein